MGKNKKELFITETLAENGKFYKIHFFPGEVRPQQGINDALYGISEETTYGKKLSRFNSTKTRIKSMKYLKSVPVSFSEQTVNKQGSVVGAAVVGGAVAGAPGAVVGAVAQASKNATSAPVTTTNYKVQTTIVTNYYPSVCKSKYGLFYRIDKLRLRKTVAEDFGRNNIPTAWKESEDSEYILYNLRRSPSKEELKQYGSLEAWEKSTSEITADYLVEIFNSFSK